MSARILSGAEALALREGREAKGAWRAGVIESDGKVWARDPGALGGPALGEVCIFNANMSLPHSGNRALCAAAPDLATSVMHWEARALRAEAERDALRAIIEGRTTPPTDAEIEAHMDARRRQRWMIRSPNHRTLVGDFEDVPIRMAACVPGCRWWALDAGGRPCAWPEVTP